MESWLVLVVGFCMSAAASWIVTRLLAQYGGNEHEQEH